MDLLNLAMLSLYTYMSHKTGPSPSHDPWDFVRKGSVRYGGSTVTLLYLYDYCIVTTSSLV